MIQISYFFNVPFFGFQNLNVTNFAILCTKCYNSLHKLLVFASLCLEWEEKLHSYSEGQTVCLENFLHYLKYQTSSKDELVEVKEEMAVDEEEHQSIKDEDTIKKDENDDNKLALVNSELEIKDESEMAVEDR